MDSKKKSDDTSYGNDIYGFYPLVRNVTSKRWISHVWLPIQIPLNPIKSHQLTIW